MAWVAVGAAVVGGVVSSSTNRANQSAAADAQQRSYEQQAATQRQNLADNRVDQINPFGSSTWSTGANGQPVQTTTLSPSNQQFLDTTNATRNALATNSQAMLSAPLSSSGAVPWQNVIGANSGGITAYDWLGQAGTNSGQNFVNNSNGATGTQAQSATQPAGGSTSAAPASPYGSAGQPAGPSYAQIFGAQGTSGGAGNGGGGSSSSSSSSSSTTTSDPYKVRDTFNTDGVTAQLPSTIDDTSRRRVEEALMSRLNPQLQQDEQALRTRLLNSGIEVGTDAYNREFTLQNQKANDARMQAVLAGGQEEDRQTKLLQGLNDQQFQQALATGKFGQDADAIMANNATSRSNAQTSAAATTGAASIASGGALERLRMELAQRSNEFNVTTGFQAAQFNNTLHQQQVAEEARLRQQTLAEMGTLSSQGAGTMPTFANYYTSTATPAQTLQPIAQTNPLQGAAAGASYLNNMWNMQW